MELSSHSPDRPVLEVEQSTIVPQASEKEVELSPIHSQTSDEELLIRNSTEQTPEPTAGRIYVFFKLESFFSFGLDISYVVADYIFMLLITLLTNVWQLKLIEAVIITNVQEGFRSICVFIVAFLDDAYLGSSLTYLLSSILYCGGLVMLYFAYPSVTDDDIESCKESDVCKEQQLGILFFLALFLVTVGQSGHVNHLKSLDWINNLGNLKKNRQPNLKRQDGFTSRIIRDNLMGYKIRNSIGPFIKRRKFQPVGWFIAIFVLPRVIEVRIQLLLCACMFGFGSCLFIAGRWLLLYRFEGPRGSPISQILQVMLVAFKKWQYDITRSRQYFERENDDSDIEYGNQTTNGLTDYFGFLNRAALYNPSPENPQAELADGRLCKVQEVEEAKCFLRATLLSLPFLMYGLVKAVSSTLFVEQATTMLRLYAFPAQILIRTSNITEYMVIRPISRTSIEAHNIFRGALWITSRLLITVFCFTAAALVEGIRLEALEFNFTLPSFWLLPQLVLMGAMNGLAKNSIYNFLSDEMPDAVSISYVAVLAEGITGIGILLSTALITLVDKFTKRHGLPGWFRHGIDDSRIDKFYYFMIGIGFLSWNSFALVAFVARFRKPRH